jgi:ubiquitin C-terminal hydrolase
MVVHVKRFYFSETIMDYRKINEKFEFNKSFNLTSMQKEKGRYDLYGIVHHYGTKNGGHYVS